MNIDYPNHVQPANASQEQSAEGQLAPCLQCERANLPTNYALDYLFGPDSALQVPASHPAHPGHARSEMILFDIGDEEISALAGAAVLVAARAHYS